MQNDHDSNQRAPLPGAGQMEDYTTAFLVVAGVLLYIGLFALWALFGLPFTMVAAFLTSRFFLTR